MVLVGTDGGEDRETDLILGGDWAEYIIVARLSALAALLEFVSHLDQLDLPLKPVPPQSKDVRQGEDKNRRAERLSQAVLAVCGEAGVRLVALHERPHDFAAEGPGVH